MPRIRAALLFLLGLRIADAYRAENSEGRRMPFTGKLKMQEILICGTMLNMVKNGKAKDEVIKYCAEKGVDHTKCEQFSSGLNAKTDQYSKKYEKACIELFFDAAAQPESTSSTAVAAGLRKSSSGAKLPALPLSVSTDPSARQGMQRSASLAGTRSQPMRVEQKTNTKALPTSSSSASSRSSSTSKHVQRVRSLANLTAKHGSESAATAKQTTSADRHGTTQSGKSSTGRGATMRPRKEYTIAAQVLQQIQEKKTAEERLDALVSSCGDSDSSPPCFVSNACTLDDINMNVGGKSTSGKKVQEALMKCEKHKEKYELLVFDKSSIENGEGKEELMIHLVIKPELTAAKIELVATSKCSKSGPELLNWIEYFTRHIMFREQVPSLLLEDDARDKRTGLVLRYSYPLRKMAGGDSRVGPDKFESWYEKSGFRWVGTKSMGEEKSFVHNALTALKGKDATTKDWVALKAAVLSMNISVFRTALICATCSHSVSNGLKIHLDDFAHASPSATLFEFMVHMYKLFVEEKDNSSMRDLLLRLVITDSWLKTFLGSVEKVERHQYNYCETMKFEREPEAKRDGTCNEEDYNSLARAKEVLNLLYLLGESYGKIGEFRKDLIA
eukprot:TRINITY_DN1134_c0_g1_i1.p1 TRINITY_DN1134_c0_g1~~TRINITY_DN1134_c0_g1_i1.p1  ORF type:complete len:616 (+),score=79.49 TRINITY_DN1134_c0_g1_i1:2-1849(+)